MKLRQVVIDSFPLRSASAIVCILHMALVLLILSIAIDMKQIAELAASVVLGMCPVDCSIIVLLLGVAVRCGVDDVEKRRIRWLVKIAQKSALHRHPRLSSAYKQHSLQIGLWKQKHLLDGWLINMNAASLLTGAAAVSSSSDMYVMLLGISALLFICASWCIYQVDYVYLRYIFRILCQSSGKDNKRDGELDEDTYHLHIQSLSNRIVDEMIRRGSNRIHENIPEQQSNTTTTLRKVKSRVRVRGRANLKLLSKHRLQIIAPLCVIFLPGVSAAIPSQVDTSNILPLAGAAVASAGAAVASSCVSLPEKKKDPLTAEQVEAFWYAINRHAEDNKIVRSKAMKELETNTKLSERTLRRWFSDAVTTTWNRDVVVQLLSRHERWSSEWHAAVQSIAKSEFGPPVKKIHSYFEREVPPGLISPVSTDSSSVFSDDSEQDNEEIEQHIFSDGGELRPNVAAMIISNLSRDTKLSKDEEDLRTALQKKWGQEHNVPSDDPLKSRREMACLILRPKSRKQDRLTSLGNPRTWTSEEDEDPGPVQRRRIRQDAQDLRALLETISRYDLNRAAQVIDSVLRSSKVLLERVRELTYDDDEFESLPHQIVESIKQCLSYHTTSRGTRPKESENLVKHLILGCVFNLDSTVTVNRIKDILETTPQQVGQAFDMARSLREKDEQIQGYTRAKRKDYIRDKLKPHIFKFCQDDRFSRLDTNQKPTRQVNPLLGDDEKVDVTSRIWLIPTLQDRYNCFLESEYYDDFVAENARSVGFTVFRDVLHTVGKFVSNPTQRSCVDDVISNLEWSMMALKKIMCLDQIREKLESFSDNEGGLSYATLMDALKAGRYSHMVRSVCCDERVYEDLPKNEKEQYLKLTCFECAHGECQNCGVTTKLEGILTHLEDMAESPETVDVMKWEKAPRQGTNDKGKQNSQLELTSRQMTISDFLQHFKDCLRECIPHFHNTKWTEWARKYDINSLKDDECIILTDFGATTNLKATETVNSATDAHLVSCNAVVLSNRRVVKVKKVLENGEIEFEEVVVFDVCYYHFLAETLTKGKKADHAMHKVCLDKIIEIMKTKGIKTVIYWTDNAPHQYKCRQTFIADASAVDRHGDDIKIIHRFAVVSQFKGPHDSAGKDVGHTLSQLERKGERSPTAYEAFKNLNKHLVKESTDWDVYEAQGDPKLKNKGVFGMSKRVVLFVGETLEEVARKKEEDPDLADFMLVCDRTHAINAEEALHKTAGIHEIRSLQTSTSEELPRKYPAIVSDLMCVCEHCLEDVENSQCEYVKWRNCRRVIMKADSASPEEVQQLLGEEVIVTFRSSANKANTHKVGMIVAHENTAKESGDKGNEWKFLVQIDDDAFEDGSVREEYLHYDEACWSMNRFKEYEASGSDESHSEWAKANPHFIPCTQCDEKAQKTCPNHMCGSCCMGMQATIPCDLKGHNSTEDIATPSDSAANQARPSSSRQSCTQCDEKSAQKQCPNHMCGSCCMGMQAEIACELQSHNKPKDTATPSDSAANQASQRSKCTQCDKKNAQKSCPNHMCGSCCMGMQAEIACELQSHNKPKDSIARMS